MNVLGAYAEVIAAAVYRQYLCARYRLGPYRFLLVLDSRDEELAYYAVMHVPDLMKRFYLESVTLLSTNVTPFLAECAEKQGLRIREISPAQERRLKSVHRIYEPDSIRFASLDFPTENMSGFMVGNRGLTKEDVLCYTTFRLFSFERAVPYETARGQTGSA